MAGFGDTVDLERSLLNLLLNSKVLTRTHAHRLKTEWFTTPERKFVAETALRVHRDSKGLLTRKVYEYEVETRVDDEKSTYYIGEWNLIEGINVAESPEVLIDLLIEADLGRRTADALEAAANGLEAGDIYDAVAALRSATMGLIGKVADKPIRELTDYKRRLERIEDKKKNPQKYLGLKTGIFPTFDRKTGGLFAGELTLLAGVTGLGKSTILKAMQWGIVQENPGRNVLHIANEEYEEQVEHKFDALITEQPYLDYKWASIADANLQAWIDKMEEIHAAKGVQYGRIFSKEVPAFTDVTLIEHAFRELENDGIKIDAIFIDHLPHVIPIGKAYGENDERAKAAGDVKELARSLQVPVVIPTQAATEVEEKQMKGKRAGKLDVYGSKAVIHVANTFMILTYKGKDDTQVHLDEDERDVFWLVDCKKNRDGANFTFRARHYVHFGKVEEVTDTAIKAAQAAVDEATGDDKDTADAEDIPETEEEVEHEDSGSESEQDKAVEPEPEPEPESEPEPASPESDVSIEDEDDNSMLARLRRRRQKS